MKFQQQGSQVHREGYENEDLEVTVDISDFGMIFHMLTAGYKYPRESCVRECMSNAIDANRESGTTLPVVVGIQNNVFFIQDYGPGISPEAMHSVYSKLGRSTKRDDPEAIGMWGIGSKSPFAYTGIFNLITVVNGIEYSYTLFKDGNALRINLEKETPVEEPNGTRVEIAIQDDYEEWEEAISEQCIYFQNIVIKTDNISLRDEKVVVLENEWVKYSNLYRRSELHLCFGNVYYPLDLGWSPYRDFVRDLQMSFGLYFGLDSGLSPTPFREDIQITEKAKKLINAKVESLLHHSLDQIEVAFKGQSFKDQFLSVLKDRFEFTVLEQVFVMSQARVKRLAELLKRDDPFGHPFDVITKDVAESWLSRMFSEYNLLRKGAVKRKKNDHTPYITSNELKGVVKVIWEKETTPSNLITSYLRTVYGEDFILYRKGKREAKADRWSTYHLRKVDAEDYYDYADQLEEELREEYLEPWSVHEAGYAVWKKERKERIENTKVRRIMTGEHRVISLRLPLRGGTDLPYVAEVTRWSRQELIRNTRVIFYTLSEDSVKLVRYFRALERFGTFMIVKPEFLDMLTSDPSLSHKLVNLEAFGEEDTRMFRRLVTRIYKEQVVDKYPIKIHNGSSSYRYAMLRQLHPGVADLLEDLRGIPTSRDTLTQESQEILMGIARQMNWWDYSIYHKIVYLEKMAPMFEFLNWIKFEEYRRDLQIEKNCKQLYKLFRLKYKDFLAEEAREMEAHLKQLQEEEAAAALELVNETTN
jgi:hypothetical protein